MNSVSRCHRHWNACRYSRRIQISVVRASYFSSNATDDENDDVSSRPSHEHIMSSSSSNNNNKVVVEAEENVIMKGQKRYFPTNDDRLRNNSNTCFDNQDKKGNTSSSIFWTTDIRSNKDNLHSNHHIIVNDSTQEISSPSSDKRDLSSILNDIQEQEMSSNRMQRRQLGLIRSDPVEDIRLLVQNYTAPALACALRDREDLLQYCAGLIHENKIDQLAAALKPFERRYIQLRRETRHGLDLTSSNEDKQRSGGFKMASLDLLRRALMKMPRRVSFAHAKRAGVVIPLCNVDGVPCILFEKRAAKLRTHADEVCLPGGMVSMGDDKSIIQTCLREMEEEIGVGNDYSNNLDKSDRPNRHKVVVLGILRCNWGEVAQITGVAVTPVVCFIGDIDETVHLSPNPDEVAECFTVPLKHILNNDM